MARQEKRNGTFRRIFWLRDKESGSKNCIWMWVGPGHDHMVARKTKTINGNHASSENIDSVSYYMERGYSPVYVWQAWHIPSIVAMASVLSLLTFLLLLWNTFAE